MAITQKTKKRADKGVSVILIIGILIVVNWMSYQIFYRLDLTQNKDYSISSVSKKVVRGLDDIVNIKVYFSNNLPNQYITLPQDVSDILDEYSSFSGGNVRVEFIDPTESETVEREMMLLGIPQLQFNVYEKDKVQVVKGYLGMAIQHGDKTEVIPVVDNTRNLEYEITLAVKKVTSEERLVVGFVTSNGTRSIEEEIGAVYEELGELYELRQIDLAADGEVPFDVKTLIIAGPTEEFTEDQLKAVDAFMMRGGSLLVLADGVAVANGLMPSKNETGLNTILEKYGIKINNDLVLDVSSGMASFSQGFITFQTNYPYWPKIMKTGFDQDNAAVAKLESAILPWASSIEVHPDVIDENNRVSYLLSSTAKSWKQADNFDLNPQQMFLPTGEQKAYVLAASIIGRFESAYGEGGTDSARLTVVGDSDFLTNRILANTPDNLILFQNLVDSLTLDEDLINIRSKGVSSRPIKEDLSDGTKTVIRYLNVFGLTLIVVIFGMGRYFARRRSRFVDEL